jgi:hypothetical protein
VCVAPCTASLPIGSHRFGVSHGDDGIVDVDSAVDTQPGSKVSFHFESNASTRTTGKAMLWTGIAAAAAASIAGLAYAMSGSNDAPLGSAQWTQNEQDKSDRITTGTAIGLVGVGVGIGVAVAGIFLQRTKDDASLARPEATAAPAPVAAQERAASTPATGPTVVKPSAEAGSMTW